MSLSLLEVEKRNPGGPRHRRFFCPHCQANGGKTPDLSIDLERGLYHCFKCGEGGILEEFRQPKNRHSPDGNAQRRARRRAMAAHVQAVVEEHASPVSEVDEEYVEMCRRMYAGSAADAYERSRGIDGIKTRMGFDPSYPFLIGEHWVHEPAVVFFFEDVDGRVVARQGRMLRRTTDEETSKITFGKVSQGVFNAAALQGEEVIVCEGPNTAAALIERGYPAIALGGKTAQEWLLEVLVGKTVWIGFDNDEAGRRAADEFITALEQRGGEADRLHPSEEGKDWNDVLLANPCFRLPWVMPQRYEPGMEDVRAACRRLLVGATGELRQLLEEWDFALERGKDPARLWWALYGRRLKTLL